MFFILQSSLLTIFSFIDTMTFSVLDTKNGKEFFFIILIIHYFKCYQVDAFTRCGPKSLFSNLHLNFERFYNNVVPTNSCVG
jgi:hypothetical protein